MKLKDILRENPAPQQPEAQPVQSLLVVVHPGSACGSAGYNLGMSQGSASRRDLARDIAAWQGPVLIIDGELSDELPDYPDLNAAVIGVVQRAKAKKLIGMRLMGSDPNHSIVAERFIRRLKLDPKRWIIELTGAWYHESNRWGCVNSVQEVFAHRGFRTNIRPSVVEASPEMEDEWDGGSEEEVREAMDPEDEAFNAQYDDEEPDYSHLPSVRAVEPLRPQLAAVAQRVYDAWTQDADGLDDELGSGGICHLIADKVADVLGDAGIEVCTVSSTHEQHVYCVARFAEGIYEIDIPWRYYERGGGFTWTKLPNIVFDPSYIHVSHLDGNPGNMEQYVDF